MNCFTEQRNLKHIEKEDKGKRKKEKKREGENEGEKSDGRILNVQFVSGGRNFTPSEKK